MNHDIIRQLREKHNLTQEALANEIGIDRSIISRWETGKADPTLEQAQLLSGFFDRPIEEFYDEEKKNQKKKRITDYRIVEKEILLIGYIFVSFLFYFSALPLSYYCVYYSIKNKMSWVFILTSIVTALYCTNGFLHIFGIYLFRFSYSL